MNRFATEAFPRTLAAAAAGRLTARPCSKEPLADAAASTHDNEISVPGARSLFDQRLNRGVYTLTDDSAVVIGMGVAAKQPT